MKWHSTKFLPALLMVVAACGGTEGDEDVNRIGGSGMGNPDTPLPTCSGLMEGATCVAAPPAIPVVGGDTEITPGEFLTPDACNSALPDGSPPGLAFDLLPGKPGNRCAFLGLTCLATNVCGAPGLTEGPGGVTMVPGPPPPPPEASVWVASWEDHITKVGTTTPIGIRGRYLGALPQCGQSSFHMGFTGAIGGAAGRIDIQNWMLAGPDISSNYPAPPATFNMNWNMLMARHGNSYYGSNMLTLGDAANESSTNWLRVPSHFYAGFDTSFQFRASGSASAFTLGLTNDGLTSRAVSPALGYAPDISLRVDFTPATDQVSLRALYAATVTTANVTASPNLADNTWRTMRVQFVVTNASTGMGTFKVWINNVLDTDAPVATFNYSIASHFLTACDNGTGNPNPSRSTVDFNNDAWVANRSHEAGAWQASVTKVAGEPSSVKCNRKTGTANDLNGVVDTSSSGALFGGTGVNDECVLFTVPAGGNRGAGNVGGGVARALAMGANDFDSGPPGSVWVGNWDHTWLGSGQSVKLRNSDGAEMAYFDLGTNPYGVAVTGPGDARVWYTNGHGGSNIQFVDGLRHDLSLVDTNPIGGAVGSGWPRNNTLACEWNNCVSNVFTQPASSGANAVVKAGSWCRNQFYGVSVDEYNNVWNVAYSCGGVLRFTPPGYKRLDTGSDLANADATDASADVTLGHWDYYQADGSTGVFVSKSQPTRRAWAFFGRDTVRMIDAITMAPGTSRYYTGTQGGHGGLGLDLTDNLWRVGGTTVSKFAPFGAHAIANGATYTNVPLEALNVGEGTYTYSDFTGYTAANITGRQVSLDRFFVSTCGDNAAKRWTRLKFTGTVPSNTALEFRVITANSEAEAASKLNASVADAGPFYLTPNVKALGTGGPANVNDSGVWLGPLVGGNVNEVNPSEILGVRVTFLSDNHLATPTLSSISIEGVCDGLPVPACTVGMPACAALCGTIQSCTPNVPTKNRTSCGSCPLCGDNVTAPPEACDDGNTVSETACAYGTANCTKCNSGCSAVLNLVGPRCGDGTIQAGNGETCDDGNTVTETACIYGQPACTKCNATCNGTLNLIGPYCGNSILDPGEVCEEGNAVDETVAPYGNSTGQTCNSTCSGWITGLPLTGYCGDGLTNGPEACDDRNTLACGTCEANCLSTGLTTARGSMTVTAANAPINDAEYFTVDDGINNPTVFEFEKAGNGVVAGRVAINIADNPAVGVVRDRVIAAINGVGASLQVTALIRSGTQLWLDSDFKGVGGNPAVLTKNVASFAVTDIGASTAGLGAHDCNNLSSCLTGEDCLSNNCVAGFCQATTCGDGIVGGTEICDDNNVVNEVACPYGQATCPRTCNATCGGRINPVAGPYCGDSAINGPEVCDDGNSVTELIAPYGTSSGVICNANCLATSVVPITGYCGDGVTNGPEACDDRNTDACGTCEANCLSTGITQGTVTIVVPAAGTLTDGQTFTINDGVHPAVVFEIDTGGALPIAPNVRLNATGGIGQAAVQANLIAAINAIPAATLGVGAAAGGPAGSVVVTIDFVGRTGSPPVNTGGITDNNVGAAGFTVAGSTANATLRPFTGGVGGRDCTATVGCRIIEDCNIGLACTANICQ